MRNVHLTLREKEILRLVVEGQTNREIAYRLSISPKTVSVHLQNVYRKIGVDSRVEAVVWFLKHGGSSVK